MMDFRPILRLKRLAEVFFDCIILYMNMNFTACSVLSASLGLGTLLLRRQAR